MIDKPLTLELYQSGLSTRQIAELLGVSKSRIHKICQAISRTQSEAAILRQPAKSKHWRTSRQQARKVWTRYNGPIPEGFHIHHKDGDYTNNALDNLECVSAFDHAYIHHPKNPVPRHLRPERQAYMKKYLEEYNASKT